MPSNQIVKQCDICNEVTMHLKNAFFMSSLWGVLYVTPSSEKQVDEQVKEVIITGIQMSVWDMMGFMVKWAIASIPAAIIIGIIMMLLYFLVFAGFIAGK